MIDTITSHENLLRLQAARIESFILDCRQCPSHITKPASETFGAADVGY